MALCAKQAQLLGSSLEICEDRQHCQFGKYDCNSIPDRLYIWKLFGQRSTNIIRYDIVSLFGKPLHYSKQLHEQNTLEGSSNLKSKSRGGMDRKEGAEFGKVVQLLLLLLCNTFLLL